MVFVGLQSAPAEQSSTCISMRRACRHRNAPRRIHGKRRRYRRFQTSRLHYCAEARKLLRRQRLLGASRRVRKIAETVRCLRCGKITRHASRYAEGRSYRPYRLDSRYRTREPRKRFSCNGKNLFTSATPNQRDIRIVSQNVVAKDLVPIIKTCHERTITRKECGHQATSVDKKYLDLAEGVLCDELSISLEIPRDQVKDFLVKRIRQMEAASNAEQGRHQAYTTTGIPG